jgi:hypothetical protein
MCERPARADARREATKPRRRGRLRLAQRGACHGQDRRGSARAGGSLGLRETRQGRRGVRRHAVCHGQSSAAFEARSEDALRAANAKFVAALQAIEAGLQAQGKKPKTLRSRKWKPSGRRRRRRSDLALDQ